MMEIWVMLYVNKDNHYAFIFPSCLIVLAVTQPVQIEERREKWKFLAVTKLRGNSVSCEFLTDGLYEIEMSLYAKFTKRLVF